MKAKIVENDKIIDVEVFTYLWSAKRYDIIVYFDSNLGELKTYFCMNPKRQGFIVDASTQDDWIKLNNDVEGYSWILPYIKQEKDSFIILNGYDIDKCKALQNSVLIPDWHEIKTTKDVESVMCASFGFHDSCVDTLEKSGDKMKIVFDNSGWGCNIEFELIGNPETNLVQNYGAGGLNELDYYDLIFCSSMFFENGFVYWVDDDKVNSTKDIKSDYFYFKANRVRWKLIIV